jgi:hypothetical protein
LDPGQAQVAGGPLSRAAERCVMGHDLDLLGQAIRVHALDGVHDGVVQLAPSLTEQARVRDVVRQRVLERVLDVREQRGLVEELRGLELVEAGAQRVVVEAGDGAQEGERHVLADHGGGLEQPLVLGRQSIDARGEDRLHGWRDLDGLRRLRQTVIAELADEGPGLDQGPDALFEEERIALGAGDEQAPQRRHARILAEQSGEQGFGALGRQGIDPGRTWRQRASTVGTADMSWPSTIQPRSGWRDRDHAGRPTTSIDLTPDAFG